MFSTALRQRWVGTLQEHVKDQLVFGRRRFGPGPHCQKQGVLELKGTKSKVYAAIITEEIWLYKSEQVRREGEEDTDGSQVTCALVCSASATGSASR